MNILAVCAGLLFAVTGNTESTTRAALVGQRMNSSFADGPLLICLYSGSRAKFEILAQSGACAPYIDVQ